MINVNFRMNWNAGLGSELQWNFSAHSHRWLFQYYQCTGIKSISAKRWPQSKRTEWHFHRLHWCIPCVQWSRLPLVKRTQFVTELRIHIMKSRKELCCWMYVFELIDLLGWHPEPYISFGLFGKFSFWISFWSGLIFTTANIQLIQRL